MGRCLPASPVQLGEKPRGWRCPLLAETRRGSPQTTGLGCLTQEPTGCVARWDLRPAWGMARLD